MLRIKKDVDLKKLKELGFDYYEIQDLVLLGYTEKVKDKYND